MQDLLPCQPLGRGWEDRERNEEVRMILLGEGQG